jgi:hypothetical protein
MKYISPSSTGWQAIETAVAINNNGLIAGNGKINGQIRAFVTAAAAASAQLSPDSGLTGESLAVTITGQFTHFAQGTTTADFGAGITVRLTVNSATSATANLSIDPLATTGPRTVTLTTGTEVVSLTNGFLVTARPFLTLEFQILVCGRKPCRDDHRQFTHFRAGTTTVFGRITAHR